MSKERRGKERGGKRNERRNEPKQKTHPAPLVALGSGDSAASSSAAAASAGVFPFPSSRDTTSAAPWLVSTSQMPSQARRRKESPAESSVVVTSGSA